MQTVDEEHRWQNGIARAVERIEVATRRFGEVAVMMIAVQDVDRLYSTVGHIHAGRTLGDFFDRLKGVSGENGAAVQLSDRKFVLVLTGFRNEGHVLLAAQKVQRLIRNCSNGTIGEPPLSVRIGISMVGRQGADAHEILRSAEIAVQDGQQSQRSVSFYQARAADLLINEWNLEQKLANALEVGELELHFQPKIELRNAGVAGVEALVRWYDRDLGQVSPDVLIKVAEKSELIKDLTYFSIQRACRQLNDWRESAGNLTIAVNVTPSIIRNLEIVDVLSSATNIWNIEPEMIVLEVTENALMLDPEASRDVLSEIREFGAKVSIDDFGTGYSSLAYLKDIPADELKIDRSFVENMLGDTGDYKIVEHAISIAKSFGLRVVAEGVPNAATLNRLQEIGCDYAQGHYICKPLPADAFFDWYKKPGTGH